MKNFFPAEWSFITPHKQGDFVRVGNMHVEDSVAHPILLDDGRVLFTGRKQSEYYDPKTRKFHLIDNDGVSIRNVSSAKLSNGEVLFFGGSCGIDKIHPKTVIFNPKTNAFSYNDGMYIDRTQHKYTLLHDGRLFIVGGVSDCDIKTYGYDIKPTEYYNPKSGKFEKGPDLPVALSYVRQVIQLKNNDIYVFGCTFVTDMECEQRIYKLVNGSDKFEYISVLPAHGGVYKLKSGKMMMLSATGKNSEYMQATIFDPKTNKVENHFLDFPEDFCTTTILLPDDTLLFIGGSSGFGIGFKQYKAAKIYDPKANELKKLKTRPIFSRNAHSTTILLKDGNVLIVGGDKSPKKPYSAEIYMFNNKIEK